VPTIDLAPDVLDTVVAILDRHLPDRDIRAIGSRITGTAKPFSDLDLVIDGSAPLDLGTLARLREEFEESSLPFTVDIVEWAVASAGFRRAIDAQAVMLRPARI